MKPYNEYKVMDFPDENLNRFHYKYDDAEYSSLESLLQVGVLGFCMCHSPSQSLLLTYDMLTMHEQFQNAVQGLRDDGKNIFGIHQEEWGKLHKAHREKIKNYIHENWQIFELFFWYVMDNKSITEHGGSLPGWVNDHNFLDALTTWKNNRDTNK